MKQTVSLLIPFKKHSIKTAIRYDTSLHAEAENSTLTDLYPRMKDPFAIERVLKEQKQQRKRKSSLKASVQVAPDL